MVSTCMVHIQFRNHILEIKIHTKILVLGKIVTIKTNAKCNNLSLNN